MKRPKKQPDDWTVQKWHDSFEHVSRPTAIEFVECFFFILLFPVSLYLLMLEKITGRTLSDFIPD